MFYPSPVPRRKGLAIASLILGIASIPTLGLLCVGALTGIIRGIIARVKASKNPGEYEGKGIAIAGINTNALSIFLSGMIAAIAIPNLVKSQQAARETAALAEVQTIGKAQVLYSVTKGHGKFTGLRTLGAEGLIDTTLAFGQKGGYLFRSEPVSIAGAPPMFDTTARPIETGTFGTGNRSFGSNETFVIYEADGAVDLKGTPTNRVPAGGAPVQ